MGTILAMKVATLLVGCLAALLSLSGCGTEKQGTSAQVLRGVASLFQPGGKTTPPGPNELLTRAVIDTVTVPYAMVGIERRGAYASMTLAGQNGPFNSWVTSDGAGIVLQGDILTGTKGLGADLITADITGVAAALRPNGPASTERVHSFLDGEGRSFAMRYRCAFTPSGTEEITIIGKTYNTRVVGESCRSNQGRFENRYWIGLDDGIMWQSRQWVSDGVGSVLVLNLVPIAN